MKESGDTWRGLNADEFGKKFENKSVAVYLDYERTFDPEYATRLGMNCDDEHLILLQPDTLEDGAKMAIDYMKLGLVCCVILDSDAMAPTNLDLESDPGDTGFGGAKGANVLKQVYKNMNLQCSNYLTPLIVISQERDSMNVMSHLPSVTGGRAIRFASSTRNRITKLETLKVGTEDAGIQLRVRNYKNKTGTPWRDAVMNLYFEGGFKVDDEYFDFLVLFDIIHKGNGGVYTADFFTEENGVPTGKIRGADNLKTWITAPERKELYDSLKAQIMEKLMSKNELDDNNVEVNENGVAENDTTNYDETDLKVDSEETTNPVDVGL